MLKQVAEREWSVSLRSRGATDVAPVAVALGGGGHRLAAGFTGYGAVAQVVDPFAPYSTLGAVIGRRNPGSSLFPIAPPR